MSRTDIVNLLRDPLVRIGLAVQGLSALLIGLIFLAIQMDWGKFLETGIGDGRHRPSPQMEALAIGFTCAVLAIGVGFVLHAIAFQRQRKSRKVQPPCLP